MGVLRSFGTVRYRYMGPKQARSSRSLHRCRLYRMEVLAPCVFDDKMLVLTPLSLLKTQELRSIMTIQDGQLWFSEKQALTCKVVARWWCSVYTGVCAVCIPTCIPCDISVPQPEQLCRSSRHPDLTNSERLRCYRRKHT